MGQKVTTHVVDKSRQDDARWALYLLVLKLINKEDRVAYGIGAQLVS